MQRRHTPNIARREERASPAVNKLPTREEAHRRNKRLLAELQVTEARLRSLARYGPANAILKAERSRHGL